MSAADRVARVPTRLTAAGTCVSPPSATGAHAAPVTDGVDPHAVASHAAGPVADATDAWVYGALLLRRVHEGPPRHPAVRAAVDARRQALCAHVPPALLEPEIAAVAQRTARRRHASGGWPRDREPP